MRPGYQAYLNYLASYARSHTLAMQAESDIYPLFVDIKKLIGRHRGTISNFVNVQNELVNFLESLSFDEDDFDYYQRKFHHLDKIDEYLQELKAKQIPGPVAGEINVVVARVYSEASLYKLEKIEEIVLSCHNKAAEARRYELAQKVKEADQTKTIVTVIIVLVVIVSLVATCSH